jgi:RecJ-like exonuclease
VVNGDVREDLFHLPAISYWEDAPARYADLATQRGLDEAGVADLRAAIAMQAHYQTYEDKREIVQDLLWEREADAFAAHVASQFRARLDEELDTVEPHVDHRSVDGVTVDVVDVEAFTHRFEFPPRDLLLDALYREARDGADGPVAVVGVDEGELHLRAAVDVRDVGGAVAEALPDAGVVPRGAGDGYLDFLIGERESVLETAVDEVATRLTTTADVETPARD